MSLEGNNSSSICCSTLLVYFLTVASSAGREIMTVSEVAGSILSPSFPEKEKIRDHCKSLQYRRSRIGYRGYLIGVPDIIWEICQV